MQFPRKGGSAYLPSLKGRLCFFYSCMHVRNEPFTRNKDGIITFMKLMTIVI